jgi:hypothetical protein
VNEQGEPKLPAKATRIYGDKPGKGEIAGRYVNERTGRVETVIYRLPAPKPVANRRRRASQRPLP